MDKGHSKYLGATRRNFGGFIFYIGMNKIIIVMLLMISAAAPAGASQRYISLAPATTEILFALGLDNEIVGVSSYCDYPQAAKSKDKVGNFSQPNIEKIISLKPDIIFATGLEQAGPVSQLRQLGLKVYVSDPSNMKELFNSIKDIGRLSAKEKEADALIIRMQSVIDALALKVNLIPSRKRPRVFVEIWHDPLITAGKSSFIDELITLAGGNNVASCVTKSYVYFSSEDVIRRNPECIILTYMGKGSLGNIKSRLGWGKISAVKNNRIYNDIDPDILLRPGPRLAEGLLELHKRLYPKDE
ncbi:MAG: cobalamin-binding protein [Candidatus Omnitrophica bacterium]|nr:cobalamin-binding protein [Candidatus Omnitrophota bacterium]